MSFLIYVDLSSYDIPFFITLKLDICVDLMKNSNVYFIIAHFLNLTHIIHLKRNIFFPLIVYFIMNWRAYIKKFLIHNKILWENIEKVNLSWCLKIKLKK